MSCTKCNKSYKSRGALTKHIAKCSDNISSTISEVDAPLPSEPANSSPSTSSNHTEQGENIVVNTTALDNVMKIVIAELFAHQHKQMYAVMEQNAKLIDENKMLVNMVQTIVLSRKKVRPEPDTADDDSDV